jgi:non-specific serine/threonine protein kinase
VSAPGDLPAEPSSFVGRRAELAEVRHLLRGTRLLTLTGVGGVGKTRLASRVAGQVRRSFPDGVRLVELAGLRDPRLVPRAVANAVGIADQSARDEVEVLVECLSDRQLLLVVDNCEHLLPAVARLLLDLLRGVPGLRVLATSREALEVTGERLYPVPPLAVPDRGPAVALFAERAATACPDFALTDANAPLVAAVCRRLDGIPLAIELAAARLRSLSLAQVAGRLDDRFALLTAGNHTTPRQQTLRGTIDWSFALCSPPERLLWMRATVFAGGFDLAAAERVCAGAGLREGELAQALAGLVAKSVLGTVDGAGGRRYRMLETIGEYGLARLRDPPRPTGWTRRRCGTGTSITTWSWPNGSTPTGSARGRSPGPDGCARSWTTCGRRSATA